MTETTVQEALSADIRLLGSILGQAIHRLAGQTAYDRVESVRAAAKELRAAPTPEAARALRDGLGQLDVPSLRTLIRAFSIYFDLINLAEQRARVRALRQRAARMGDAPQAETPQAAFLAARDAGIGPEQVRAYLDSALICPVFTAHPSEARRRTVLEKLNAIGGQLDRLELGQLLASERDQVHAAIAEEIETFWLTNTVRIERPSVLDEIRQNIDLVEGSLFDVVPRVYRELTASLNRVYPGETWRVPPLLQFGSWIGGDRDGHPHVTHRVTREAIRTQQTTVLNQYLTRVAELERKLSHSDQFVTPGPAFRERLEAESAQSLHGDDESPHELYRAWCRVIHAKLGRTLHHVKRAEPSWTEAPGVPPGDVYLTREALLDDLRLLQDDLVQAGAESSADGMLQDIIRLVEVFGMHLMTLDLRQHSARHARALDEIFRLSGVHDAYLELDAEQRLACLVHELEQKRPLIPAHLAYSDDTKEVVLTFRTMAAILEYQAPQALHNYIISSTTEPAHLLEVLLLAREARLFLPHEGISRIDIIPLFEALEPLRQSGPIMQRLLDLPIYRRHLELRGNVQEVMLGYSDSSKESGSLQSAWALYRTQGALVELARRAGITIQMFHGRGGAIGRGGGPANRAILAQPPGTVRGRLRMTEQGEVIADRYGHRVIAERHLEQVINAVLLSSFPRADAEAKPEWSAILDQLAHSACEQYRGLVYETPAFLTYYEQATPIEEIASLKIGSRPTRRSGSTSIENLRAIPWVFSWMQCRHTLPGWFGFGGAVEQFLASRPDGLAVLQEMYRSWPFWTTLVDNLQMILAKADMTIARLYADLVAETQVADDIYGLILAEYQKSVRSVCRITEEQELLDTMPILQNSIQRRNPYVDPLSFIQLVLLSRLRSESQPAEEIQTGVLESISGVASGLKNTG